MSLSHHAWHRCVLPFCYLNNNNPLQFGPRPHLVRLNGQIPQMDDKYLS